MLGFLYFYYCFLNCELELWVPNNKFFTRYLTYVPHTMLLTNKLPSRRVFFSEAELADCSVNSKDSISLPLSLSPSSSIFLLCSSLLSISRCDSLTLLCWNFLSSQWASEELFPPLQLPKMQTYGSPIIKHSCRTGRVF